jgi:predicted nuclease with RNAse H fold
MRGNEVIELQHSTSPAEMLDWCLARNVFAVGIDAPCRWSSTSGGREAEHQLRKVRISSFSTPRRERGESHPFYGWMVNGASLYKLIEREFPLFDGKSPNDRFCVETFPHAVACEISGSIVSAKQKTTVRRSVLRDIDVDTTLLRNIDYVDAALCAIAARSVANASCKPYGSVTDGYIVVPITGH